VPESCLLTLDEAAEAMRRGDVVACPAEGVWGLSCNPFSEDAVKRLLAIKRRPEAKGLILIAADVAETAALTRCLSDQVQQRIRASWPGHVTWILPDVSDRFPAWIKGDHSRLAVRVSAHPPLQALAARLGGWMVSTSANLSGEVTLTSPDAIHRCFGSAIAGVLDANTGTSTVPSSIFDAETGRQLR
jgi:L-threonylcarbamoyladenylate synthase